MARTITLDADSVLRTGKFYFALGLLTALVPIGSTLATASISGGKDVAVPSLPARPGGLMGLWSVLLLHGSMLLPVLLFAAAAVFLLMGASRLRGSHVGTSRADTPGANEGTNKALATLGWFLVILAVVTFVAFNLLFVTPCSDRASACWKVAEIMQSMPLLTHIWAPLLVALLGVVLTALAMPKRSR